MESIFFVGEPYNTHMLIWGGDSLTRTVELPKVLPSKFEVFKGRERLARGIIGEMLRMTAPPADRTEVEMGSKLAFEKELPRYSC